MIRRKRHDSQAFDEAWNARARPGGTAFDAEIADLVQTAEQICQSAVIEPSTEFRSALRVQLLAEAQTVLVVPDAETHRVRLPRLRVQVPSYAVRRRIAGATAAFVGAAGFVGMVGTSAQALPGEMLYPVKRGVENVQLAFQGDDATRGEFRLAQASERLAEARQLTDDGSAQKESHVAGVLDDFSVQATDGSGALFRSYDQNGSESSITAVNDFSAAAAADLARLAGEVPSDADQSFQAAADTVSDLITRASRLCSSCVTADIGSLVGAVTALDGASTTPASPNAGPSTSPGASTTNIEPGTAVEPKPTLGVPALPLGQSPPSTSVPSPGQQPLKELTDPITGALLGDETQPGLVPSLLDGVLGNQP